MKHHYILALSVIGIFLGAQAMSTQQKGPQFKVAWKEGRGHVQMVDSGSPQQESEPIAPPPGLKPEDLEQWRAEVEAEQRRKSQSALKKKTRREERWYSLPAGTLKVKVSGGSGNYRFILSKTVNLLSDQTTDTVQDRNPIFKNVSAGLYTVRVIDLVTKCEASSDFSVNRETADITVAQFKPLAAKC